MTSLLIVFKNLVTNEEIIKLLHQYWSVTSLKEHSLPKQKELKNRQYELIQKGKIVAEIIINDKGATHGLSWVPRLYQNTPYLFFNIDPDAGYNPQSEAEDRLIEWPRYLLASKDFMKIRYIFMINFIEYFHSADELTNFLCNERNNLSKLQNKIIVNHLDDSIQNGNKYSMQTKDPNDMIKRFLQSKIVNDLFYIEYKNDGILFVNRPTAVEWGLTDEEGFGIYSSLIDAFRLYIESTPF